MTLTRHAFRGDDDISGILDLIRSMPLACRHVVDFPWRLGTTVISEGRDSVFWATGDGQVVGFAAWQPSWAALDFFIRSGPEEQATAADLFAWADGRFRERDQERGHSLPYWVEFRDDDKERRRLVESYGFVHEEKDRYVLLHHPLTDLPPVSPLPNGFTFRPPARLQEAVAYAELLAGAFGDVPAHTSEWRRRATERRARTICAPLYQPELDLVIAAPDGSFAGFCLGWFEPSRRVAQIEPLGIHPRFHRLGLGRAILQEMLHRFKMSGASSAIVETDADRIPARRVYESVNFQPIHTIRCKGKWLN